MNSYNVPQLVEAVREAVARNEEREQAFNRLKSAVGGEGYETIRNAQYRIGWLMTEEET